MAWARGMCTVSLLRGPWADAEGKRRPGDLPLFRLAANRDEQRSRPEALPPRVTRCDGLGVLAPLDPLGGGTWIAASTAGLVFVLLNEYGAAEPIDRAGRRSRGLVIPALAGGPSLAAARERILALAPTSFLPFRLLAVDRHELIEVVSDGRAFMFGHRDATSARVLRTSSLVDEVGARTCRTALFDRLVAGPSRWAQDAFHRARWPDDDALGVRMARADARTVSRTSVEVYEDRIAMTYCPEGSGRPCVTEQLRTS